MVFLKLKFYLNCLLTKALKYLKIDHISNGMDSYYNSEGTLEVAIKVPEFAFCKWDLNGENDYSSWKISNKKTPKMAWKTT